MTWVFSPTFDAVGDDGNILDNWQEIEITEGETLFADELEETGCFRRKSYGDWWEFCVDDDWLDPAEMVGEMAVSIACALLLPLVRSITLLFDVDPSDNWTGFGEDGNELSDDESEDIGEDSLRSFVDWYNPLDDEPRKNNNSILFADYNRGR